MALLARCASIDFSWRHDEWLTLVLSHQSEIILSHQVAGLIISSDCQPQTGPQLRQSSLLGEVSRSAGPQSWPHCPPAQPGRLCRRPRCNWAHSDWRKSCGDSDDGRFSPHSASAPRHQGRSYTWTVGGQQCIVSSHILTSHLTPHTSPVSQESSGQSYDGLSSGVEADCVELEGVNPHLLVGREERKRVSAGKTAKPFFWGTTLTALTITHGRPDNTQVRGQRSELRKGRICVFFGWKKQLTN